MEKLATTVSEPHAKREYKDTVFRMLFSDKEKRLSLYNAMNDRHYENAEDLKIVTLKSAIYMGMKNDLAFMVDTQICLYEYQSTKNPNMPLRDMFYISLEYQAYVNNKSLYSSTLQKLPTPKFVIECTELRLSDAYENLEGEPNLELRVIVLNVNEGCNRKLMEHCQVLKEYAQYVAKVRRYTAEMELDAAVKRAVEECIAEGILEDFLRENRAEVEMVSILEYDKDFEEKKLRKAEYEAGREEGARFGLAEGIVETGCAYNVPEPDILARLQEKLDIPLRKAQEYFAMYSK